jgi:alpha-tubulin suppressor-like RCC1 family protein
LITPSLPNNNITKITTGYEHTVVLRNKQVWTFGRGDNGRLCVGTTVDNRTPQLVQDFNDVIDINSGNDHTLILNSNGVVYTCGQNSVKELLF